MTAKRTETALTLSVALFSIAANFWHVFVSWIHKPVGGYFTGITHYYADYFLYVTQIAEGIRGNVLWSRSLFTNEPVPATWVYWPNVLIGNIGRVAGLSAFFSYIVGLFVFVCILLILIRTLIRELFPTSPLTRSIGFLFAVTASNFFSLTQFLHNGSLTLWQDMWFSPTPALNRLGGVPHQTLQTILILAVLVVFHRVVKAREHITYPTGIALPLLCFLAATLSPIQLLLVSAALLGTTAIQMPAKKATIIIGISVAMASIGAYAVNASFDTSFLYTAAKNWEAAQRPNVSVSTILLAMGPVLFFLPFGVTAFVRTLHPLKLVLLLYGGFSLAVFVSPIPVLLHTSPTRWIHPASLLVYYAIAAEGIVVLTRVLATRIARLVPRWNSQLLPTIILNTLLFLYCILTLPAIISQIQARITPVLSSTLNYVPDETMAMLTALASSPRREVVLMDPTLPYDVLVPVITGKISFTGHPVHTLYLSAKEQLRIKFFSGQMNSEEAQKFLADHRIGEVVYSQVAVKAQTPYPFLRRTYQNDAVATYEVIR